MIRQRIAIQGGPASFSHAAAERLLGSDGLVTYRFLSNFREVVEELHGGRADAALLPIENSVIGPIPGIQALLKEGGLRQQAGLQLPVHHCLVGLAGSRAEQLQQVHSHPAALAQCRRFLRRHPQLEAMESEDTANSLALIRTRGDRGQAAIASAEAAAFHGLPILQGNIQDEPDNTTEFGLFLPSIQRAFLPRPGTRGGHHHQLSTTKKAKPV